MSADLPPTCIQELVVRSSWKVANDRRIRDSVTFGTTDTVDKREGLEKVVSLETCVLLTNQPASTPCTIELRLDATKQEHITKLTVVSEARIIEVYGKCGEYLSTTQADFIDEYDGMVVYSADIVLSTASPECLLKFARLKSKEQMWLYGIHLTVEGTAPVESVLAGARVNFQNVNARLKDTSQPLSEKAERSKKFLQLYGSIFDTSKAQTKIPDAQMLVKMLEADCLSQCHPLGNGARNVSKRFSELLPMFSPSKTAYDRPSPVIQQVSNTAMGSGNIDNKTCQPLEKLLQEEVQVLKLHIDQQFKDMEERLTKKMEEEIRMTEKRQNEKLDLILELLQKEN